MSPNKISFELIDGMMSVHIGFSDMPGSMFIISVGLDMYGFPYLSPHHQVVS